jgi:hypothetical protein
LEKKGAQCKTHFAKMNHEELILLAISDVTEQANAKIK